MTSSRTQHLITTMALHDLLPPDVDEGNVMAGYTTKDCFHSGFIQLMGVIIFWVEKRTNVASLNSNEDILRHELHCSIPANAQSYTGQWRLLKLVVNFQCFFFSWCLIYYKQSRLIKSGCRFLSQLLTWFHFTKCSHDHMTRQKKSKLKTDLWITLFFSLFTHSTQWSPLSIKRQQFTEQHKVAPPSHWRLTINKQTMFYIQVYRREKPSFI